MTKTESKGRMGENSYVKSMVYGVFWMVCFALSQEARYDMFPNNSFYFIQTVIFIFMIVPDMFILTNPEHHELRNAIVNLFCRLILVVIAISIVLNFLLSAIQ